MTSPSPSPVIEVEGLTKRYKKAQANAVDGVSFAVGAGEFFALLGPNGAGKTTTISILTTTLAPTAGAVRIAGHDISRDAAAVRRAIGIVFQKPSLDQNLTAEENVRFHAVLYGLYPFRPFFGAMPRAYRDQVKDLADLLDIGDALFKPLKTFSGGMKRKLEIVRCLVHRPKVLFLDEPTVGLDPTSRRDLWQYLDGVRREHGTTVFLTTHYLDEAEGADTVCVVNHGRLVTIGSPERVKADLVHEHLHLDSAPADRAALRRELAERGVAFEERAEGGFRVAAGTGEVHALLRAVQTPLTEVRTHAPTLEDAYLALIAEPEETGVGGASGDAA